MLKTKVPTASRIKIIAVLMSKSIGEKSPEPIQPYLKHSKIPVSGLYIAIFFQIPESDESETMTLSIEPNTLVRGNYSIHAFINQPKVAQLDVAEDVCKFTVIDPGSYLSKHGEYDYGSVFGRYIWE